MTRYEWITSLGKEKMAKVLCSMSDCDECLAQEECNFLHNGFVDWLEEEIEEEMKEKTMSKMKKWNPILMFCKHHWKVNRWHWFHGFSGNEPRRAEVELVCETCGKLRYIYPERGSVDEGVLQKEHLDKYW